MKIKGKAYNYQLRNLRQLYWLNKILLLPVIIGGLLSTLSLLAYMNDLLHPWILIVLLISGILLLYYGFTGAPALVVRLENSEEIYLTFKHNVHLQGFTDFVNRFINQKMKPEYFIFITEKEWENANKAGFLVIDEQKILHDSPSEADNQVILKIDFQLINGTITYLPSPNNELAPYVTENIPLSAITRIG